jgi:protein SCO1
MSRSPTRGLALALALVAPALAGPALAAPHSASDFIAETPPALAAIDVREQLGAQVPLDLRFRDQHGRPVVLADLIRGDLPIVLTFNYSSCPSLCSMQLNGLVEGLAALDLAAGVHFRVISIVIEPKEPAARARETRDVYLGKLEALRPGRRDHAGDDGWTFLVADREGDDAAIRHLAETVGVGYRYVPEQAEWGHPAVLVFLSARGLVTRYVHGIQYDTGELITSIARAGVAEPSAAAGFLQRCLHWNPTAGSRADTGREVMRYAAAGFAAIVLAGLLFVHLLRRGRHGRSGVARS